MNKQEPTPAYIPGVCNINSQETAQRRLYGYIGTTLFIIGLVLLILLVANRWIRLVLFIPAFLASSGLLQARYHFCTHYGTSGKQNAAEGSPKAIDVLEQAAIRKDKQRSRQINVLAAGYAVLLTLLCLVIPVLH